MPVLAVARGCRALGNCLVSALPQPAPQARHRGRPVPAACRSTAGAGYFGSAGGGPAPGRGAGMAGAGAAPPVAWTEPGTPVGSFHGVPGTGSASLERAGPVTARAGSAHRICHGAGHTGPALAQAGLGPFDSRGGLNPVWVSASAGLSRLCSLVSVVVIGIDHHIDPQIRQCRQKRCRNGDGLLRRSW